MNLNAYVLLCFLFVAATATFAQKPAKLRDSGTIVFTLGADTTFVHKYEMRGDSFYSEILSLPQGLRYVEGRGAWFPNGNLKAVSSSVSALGEDGAWSLAQETRLETTADSTRILQLRDGKTTDRSFAGHCMITNSADAASFQLFPFYAFRAPRRVGDSLTFRHVTGLGGRDFVVKRTAKNTVRVGSSLMGPITLYVDKKNRLLSIDALGSSLNFTAQVYRAGVDIAAMKDHFAQKQLRLGMTPALSVRDTVHFSQGGQDITLHYWRPSARGRKVFGGIVPVGRFWRFGANNATEISFSKPVLIAGQRLDAGRYTLFALPSSEQDWQLCFNKKTGIWGTEYDPAADVLRVPLHVESLPAYVETFTLAVLPETGGGVLNAYWENTRLWVRFGNENR
jgi:hypothetical protein